MFAIAPQSATLITPGVDEPPITIDFHLDGEDASRCIMDVTMPNGDQHHLTFNVRGAMVDQQFVEYVEPEQTVQDEGEPQDHGNVEKVQAEPIKEPPHQTGTGGEKQPA